MNILFLFIFCITNCYASEHKKVLALKEHVTPSLQKMCIDRLSKTLCRCERHTLLPKTFHPQEKSAILQELPSHLQSLVLLHSLSGITCYSCSSHIVHIAIHRAAEPGALREYNTVLSALVKECMYTGPFSDPFNDLLYKDLLLVTDQKREVVAELIERAIGRCVNPQVVGRLLDSLHNLISKNKLADFAKLRRALAERLCKQLDASQELSEVQQAYALDLVNHLINEKEDVVSRHNLLQSFINKGFCSDTLWQSENISSELKKYFEGLKEVFDTKVALDEIRLWLKKESKLKFSQYYKDYKISELGFIKIGALDVRSLLSDMKEAQDLEVFIQDNQVKITNMLNATALIQRYILCRNKNDDQSRIYYNRLHNLLTGYARELGTRLEKVSYKITIEERDSNTDCILRIEKNKRP